MNVDLMLEMIDTRHLAEWIAARSIWAEEERKAAMASRAQAGVQRRRRRA